MQAISLMTLIALKCIMQVISLMTLIALGIADHVWQDKRATIAGTVDALGDQFRPAMRAGWLSYIRTAYPENAAPAAGLPVGQGLW